MEKSGSNQLAARLIDGNRAKLCEAVLDEAYRAAPGFWERFGQAGRASALKDIGYHFDYLVEALRYDSPRLLTAYWRWLGELFVGLRFTPAHLQQTWASLRLGLASVLPPDSAATAIEYLDAVGLPEAEGGGGFGATAPLGKAASEYLEALLAGDRGGAMRLVRELMAGGMPIKAIYIDVFQTSLARLGQLWLRGEISVAKEHFCTAATQAIIAQLYPSIMGAKHNGRSLVAASVGGELHEIGIRMVADFFEMEGWATYYLGANNPASGIVSAIRDRNACLLCLSTSIVSNLPGVAAVISLVRQTFTASELKIIVGGAPFNVSPGLWERMGADGWAPDAISAPSVAAAICG